MYLLVPQGAGTQSATVWVASDEPPAPQLELATTAGTVGLGSWQVLPAAGAAPPRLWFQRISLSGLAPRQHFRVELRQAGAVLADATLRTLPAGLPTLGERPFTVLHASCFHAPKDPVGSFTATYQRLPDPPDVKIFCGDQVYLDEPWTTYAVQVLDGAELAQRHLATYWNTWAQPAGAPGRRPVLADGPNYFLADDHEFWNNAPSFGTYILNSWSQSGRDEWDALARELYHAFQATSPREAFAVGPLSFLMLDTRLNRSADRARLVDDDDLSAVARWVGGLAGPGVLVVGQPVFADKAGLFGRFVDWGMPDYEQYGALAGLLANAQHSIVVLTGDLHFGRLASCTLASGAELIELLASPAAVANPALAGDWDEAPGRFPAFAIPGIGRHEITTDEAYQMTANHFLALEFTGAGGRVEMTVKAWPVTAAATPAVVVGKKVLR